MKIAHHFNHVNILSSGLVRVSVYFSIKPDASAFSPQQSGTSGYLDPGRDVWRVCWIGGLSKNS